MKQRDWFWCGAVLFALMMFISLQSIQEPMYAGIAGGICALASATLFGYGLRAETQEQSALNTKHAEEERERLEARRKVYTEDMERIHNTFETLKREIQTTRKSAENESQTQKESIIGVLDYLREWFDAQQQSYTVALHQIQIDFTAVTEEIRTLQKAISGGTKLHETALAKLSNDIKECSSSDQSQAKESTKAVCDSLHEQHTAITTEIQILQKAVANETQLHKTALAQIAQDIRECSASDQVQAKENSKAICASLREQHDALNKVLADYKAKFEKYCGFMIDQPWDEIKTLSEGLQSIREQADNMLSSVESISSATEQLTKKALDRLTKDSKSLQKKLENVCETLETQGRENRDTMDRMMQGYSDVTAQDVEILTALTRNARV